MARVLVVDDSKLMRNMLSAGLGKAGYEVEEVAPESLADLLKRLKAEPFDALITDHEMPPFTGEQLIRSIRADAKLAALPVLVLTSHNEEALIERMGKLQVEIFLTKPILVGKVLEALELLIG